MSESASTKDIFDLAPNSCAATSSPKVLEAGRGQLGTAHRVLDVLVSEIRLKGSRVVALGRQREAAGMSLMLWVAKKIRRNRSTEDINVWAGLTGSVEGA